MRGRIARGALLDLPLVALVLLAVLTRTPVGGLAIQSVRAALGDPAEQRALTAYFLTGIPVEVAVLVEQSVPLELEVPVGGLPEPWRTAATLGLEGTLPEAAQAEAARAGVRAEPLAVLDHLYEGSPEAALETYAVGAEQRARAIGRAQAAGLSQPERYTTHRAYLPSDKAREADDVMARTLGLATILELRWPVESGRISSGYGERTHPVLGSKRFHNGVDIAVPVGTPIQAAQGGTVDRARYDRLNGNYVVIDHGHGVRTSYCHLDEAQVEEGAVVTPGQLIGSSGNTGRSTGPHLHWTVRVGRETVDPERLAPNGMPPRS